MAELAKYPGVTLDGESETDGNDLIIDSPAGKIFAANGIHSIVEPFRNQGGQSWKADVITAIREQLPRGWQEAQDVWWPLELPQGSYCEKSAYATARMEA